jgi:hypothetical protein
LNSSYECTPFTKNREKIYVMKSLANLLTRRELLKGATMLGLTGALSPLAGLAQAPARNKGIIGAENNKPGTTDWQLTFVRSKDYRSEMIEGYCSRTSVKAGEDIDFFLSANPATDVTVNIYRMGYYGGKGGRTLPGWGHFLLKRKKHLP